MKDFMHMLSVKGSRVADPRAMLKVKFRLLRAVASFIDTSQDSNVSEEEMIRACVKVGVKRDDAKRVFREIDKNHTGLLHWDELCRAFVVEGSEWQSTEVLAAAYQSVKEGLVSMTFKVLNSAPGRSGDMQEVSQMLYQVGVKKKEADIAFWMIDTQHRGRITTEELLEAIFAAGAGSTSS